MIGKHFILFLLVTGIISFSACPGTPKQQPDLPSAPFTDSTSSGNKNKSPSASDRDPELKNIYKGEGLYLRMEGDIGNNGATVFLVGHKTVDPKNKDHTKMEYQGYYYYNKYQEPIPLQTAYNPDEEGDIVLYENYWADAKIVWILNKRNDKYIGAWYDDKTRKRVEIELRESYPDNSPNLNVYYLLGESKLVGNDRGDSYIAGVDLQFVFPKMYDNASEDKQYAMIWNIIPAFAGDQLAEWFGTPEQMLETMYLQFVTGAKENAKTLEKENPDLLENEFKYHQMTIVHHDNKHLVFKIYREDTFSEIYQNDEIRFINLSLPEWKELTLENVLLTGYEEKLKSVLLNSAERKFATMPEWELDPSFAEPTDHYAITNKGIWFSYPPGHFNGFDKMHREVFASFAELGAFVKEEWR